MLYVHRWPLSAALDLPGARASVGLRTQPQLRRRQRVLGRGGGSARAIHSPERCEKLTGAGRV